MFSRYFFERLINNYLPKSDNMNNNYSVSAITRAVRADIHRDHQRPYDEPYSRSADDRADGRKREARKEPSEFEIILNRMIEERRESEKDALAKGTAGIADAAPKQSPEYGKIIDISSYLGNRFYRKGDN